ncbi:glycosyl hydrolase family 5 [Acetobacteraceae bacterium H6797]|nr:glycosyl hydrolase family 5 [Acetobacteraceae bacterium H6797]
MKRRTLLALAASCLAPPLLARDLPLAPAPRGGPMSQAMARKDWESFKSRYFKPDGRIIDTGNGGISHSEGQGFGLLMAVRFDDRAAFERILAFSTTALRRPDDTLFAWRYRLGDTPPVSDLNNATDGDLCAAWALQQAALRWRQPAYAARAIAMAKDILRRCVITAADHTLLLPGVEGFLHPDRLVLNLSYYILPALADLSVLLPDPAWSRLIADGLAVMRQARYGRWSLPPDWLELPRGVGRPRIAAGRPPRFSFDAVRIPLNLVWAGLSKEPCVAAAASFWLEPEFFPRMPAWADLRDGGIAPYAAPAGIEAVACLAVAAMNGQGRHRALPLIEDAQDYYNALLVMSAHFAWEDCSL